MTQMDQIRAEVLEALENAVMPMGRQDLLPLCPSADNAQQISVALHDLKNLEQAERTAAGWNAATPGPAARGIARSTKPKTGDLTPPRFGDQRMPEPGDPIIQAIRRLPAPRPIADAARKARALRELADWPAMDGSVADYLREIADDIEAVACES